MDIYELLDSLQSSDRKIRKPAEDKLFEIQVHGGFLESVLGIASDSQAPLERRQLCLTILKDVIRRRWDELASDDVRKLLPGLLCMVVDGNKSIRSLCHSCLGYAVSHVGVRNWPELFETISSALLASTYPVEMKVSVLSLLTTIINECGGSAFGDSVHDVTSLLLQVAKSLPADQGLGRRIFSVFCSLLVNLSKDEELSLLSEINISEWNGVLSFLAHSGEVADIIWVLRDLKDCFSNNVNIFPQSMVYELILDSISWLERSRYSFESLVILSEEGGIDETEETGGLSSLVVCICEFINAISLNEIYSSTLVGTFLRFVKAVAPFLQISILTEQEWMQYPGEFIASEQEEFSATTIRLSFEGLVADALWNPQLGDAVSGALLEASEMMIADGLGAKEHGNSEWWRRIEAGLLIFGFLTDTKIFNITKNTILQQCTFFCCSNEPCHLLLRARAFIVLAQFRSGINSIDVERGILEMSVSCMSSVNNPVLIFAACRALIAFVQENNNHFIEGPNGAFAALLNLCSKQASPDESVILHFCLDALLSLIPKCPNCLKTTHEWTLFLCNLVREKVNDPIAPDQVKELVVLSSKFLPLFNFDSLASLLAREVKPWLDIHAEHRLDVALDIIAVLVQNASIPFPDPLVECVLIVNNGHLGQVGPITTDMVQSILTTCAVRSSPP